MRKLWIDTDCCCDDALAMIMAFYHPDVEVCGISVVSGYRPASHVWKNPFIICQEAQVPTPPIYVGRDGTLVDSRAKLHDVHVHGEDGMGDLALPFPAGAAPEPEHAALGILKAIASAPRELEIVTLGPLTNLALAFQLDPAVAKNIRKLWLMGGVGKQDGNISSVVEANIGGDPEAARLVLRSGVPLVIFPYDPAMGDARYTRQDMEALARSGRAGSFIARANHDLLDILPEGGSLFEVDPAAMAAVLWPDLILEHNEACCDVECAGLLTCGQLIEDRTNPETFNCSVVHKIDGVAFKTRTLDLFRQNCLPYKG